MFGVNVYCNYCKKKGHFAKKCFKRLAQQQETKKPQEEQQKPKQQQEAKDEDVEIYYDALTTFYLVVKDGQDKKKVKDSWVIQTNTTSHITNNREFFTEFTPCEKRVKHMLFGWGVLPATGIGSGTLTSVNDKGRRVKVTLENVLYVPEISCSIFSVMAANEDGCSCFRDYENERYLIRNKDDEVIMMGEMDHENVGNYTLTIVKN